MANTTEIRPAGPVVALDMGAAWSINGIAVSPGAKLACWRRVTGMTQGAMATAIGVTGRVISEIERAMVRPRPPVAVAIQGMTGIPAGEWLPELCQVTPEGTPEVTE